ncbi:alcohol dehydrogenase [Dendrobium catenatum]|uniref:Alcohol dehydrogenase n=1 Tax=Dendrobium catenatum TaxID=906689 RepID=A0A2I0WE22_9ASPA|nr:alcohol dehydrogenase [Dendrobium catenatum]
MDGSNTIVDSSPVEQNEQEHIDNDVECDSDEYNNVDVGDVGDNVVKNEENNKKKKMRLTSTVWGHYEMLPVGNDGKQRCKCKKCGATYLSDSKNGTGNLRHHIENYKKRDSHDIGQLILQSNTSTSISMVENKFDYHEFRNLFTACIVKHDLPFQCVEWSGLRSLL